MSTYVGPLVLCNTIHTYIYGALVRNAILCVYTQRRSYTLRIPHIYVKLTLLPLHLPIPILNTTYIRKTNTISSVFTYTHTCIGIDDHVQRDL